MKLKVFTNTQLDIKQTTKVYADYYGRIILKHAIKAVDKLDNFLVNH